MNSVALLLSRYNGKLSNMAFWSAREGSSHLNNRSKPQRGRCFSVDRPGHQKMICPLHPCRSWSNRQFAQFWNLAVLLLSFLQETVIHWLNFHHKYSRLALRGKYGTEMYWGVAALDCALLSFVFCFTVSQKKIPKLMSLFLAPALHSYANFCLLEHHL